MREEWGMTVGRDQGMEEKSREWRRDESGEKCVDRERSVVTRKMHDGW